MARQIPIYLDPTGLEEVFRIIDNNYLSQFQGEDYKGYRLVEIDEEGNLNMGMAVNIVAGNPPEDLTTLPSNAITIYTGAEG